MGWLALWAWFSLSNWQIKLSWSGQNWISLEEAGVLDPRAQLARSVGCICFVPYSWVCLFIALPNKLVNRLLWLLTKDFVGVKCNYCIRNSNWEILRQQNVQEQIGLTTLVIGSSILPILWKLYYMSVEGMRAEKASYVWVEFWRFRDITSPLTWSELQLLPSESRIGEETAFTDGVEVGWRTTSDMLFISSSKLIWLPLS